MTAQSILRLYPERFVAYPQGQVLFEGRDILGSDLEEVRRIRGGRVGMIFQEPMSSLNPLHTVVRQLSETLTLHQGLSAAKAATLALEWLSRVGLSEPGAEAPRLPPPALRRANASG